VVTAEISCDIFPELFNFGFIKIIHLDETTRVMVSKCHDSVVKFVDFLWQTRHHRDEYSPEKVHGICVYSAPPMFYYYNWSTLGQFHKNKPQIFLSVHILEERQDCSIQEEDFQLIEEFDRKQPNYAERRARLEQMDDRSIDLTAHYTWGDFKGILCRASLGQNRDSLAIGFAIGKQELLPIMGQVEESVSVIPPQKAL